MSEFFRDLDVVPSDIVAGLVLLRHIQKREENRLIYQSLCSSLPIENKVCYESLYNNTCSFCIFIGRELCVIKVHTYG